MKCRARWTRCIAVIAMVVLLAGQALPAQAKAVEAKVIASVMEIKDTSGEVIGTLKKGAVVTVHGTNGKLAKITYKGKKGIARLSDLEKIAAAPAPEATTEPSKKPTPAPKPTRTPKPTPTPKPSSKPTPKPTEAAGESGEWMTVKAEDSRAYAAASTKSKILKTLRVGDKVQIVQVRGNWARCLVDGKKCYMQKTAFTDSGAESTNTPAPTSSENADKTLKQGDKGQAVKKLQLRLEVLGHFDGDPAGSYLSLTTDAVKRFQSAAGLSQTGVADEKTQKALYSDKAKKNSILKAVMSQGDRGENVSRAQQRLKTKGYFEGAIDGQYGSGTAYAVEAFQYVVGLKRTGQLDNDTVKRLFSSKAPKKPAGMRLNPPSVSTPAPENTQKPDNTPKPTQAATPKPTSAPEPAAPSSSKADQVIAAAKAQLGKPYVYGRTGMSSFDCSGLTVYAYKQVGVSLARTAYSQGYGNGTKVTKSQLKRGDIVCFNTISDSDLSDHVGIYLGGNEFIHASSGSGKVVISSMASGYYDRVFSWGRRVL